jgi:hypothetical protein
MSPMALRILSRVLSPHMIGEKGGKEKEKKKEAEWGPGGCSEMQYHQRGEGGRRHIYFSQAPPARPSLNVG